MFSASAFFACAGFSGASGGYSSSFSSVYNTGRSPLSSALGTGSPQTEHSLASSGSSAPHFVQIIFFCSFVFSAKKSYTPLIPFVKQEEKGFRPCFVCFCRRSMKYGERILLLVVLRTKYRRFRAFSPSGVSAPKRASCGRTARIPRSLDGLCRDTCRRTNTAF